ncbi:leucine-rich repeat domain-containing protein [Flavobacterium psychroterrae]|uniref:Leucine-rich repeat domain-containing protein n=1 Tax=Flavobacterium psychroterrae TaxID=2133767 RepID=A0ABS5P7P0_9FLAO|nr:leucine-rich repeat domain-containing protein [Flavobacterium psychroterrae]MBS7230323.1 leucine-rich repeat domain-containing protein [Flavobacterium psychroterrae]
MLDKPSIIIEIELFLQIKLIRENDPFRAMGILKKNCYSVDADNKVVALNLQKIPLEIFPFFRDLQNLKYLNLSNTELREISFIQFLTELKYLNLSSNDISDLENIISLRHLEYLNLFNNRISSLYFIQELKEIKTLILSNNNIGDVKPLSYLTNLISLDLSNNLLSDISSLNKLNQLQELILSKNRIKGFPYIPNLSNLNHLNLSSNGLEDIFGIENHLKIDKLNLSNNKIYNIRLLQDLSNLRYLYIHKNEIEDLTSIDDLYNLRVLNASNNQIRNFFFPNLKRLLKLFLSNNPLDYINLEYNERIIELYLNNTLIKELDNFDILRNLRSLHLHNNQLYDIRFLFNLKKLLVLDLSSNNIEDISPLIDLPLKSLSISDNPIENIEESLLFKNTLEYLSINDTIYAKNNNLELSKTENHLNIIKNKIIIKNSLGETVDSYYPVKILLLGNHSSGKSQFLNYFLNNTLQQKSETTDILQIKFFKDKRDSILPTAVFYDFGGQDFYHGLYRIFLSNQSIHCLFWHTKTNFNKYELDIKDNPIQNFNVNYWIGQKKYNEYKEDFNDDLFLIETHSDLKESNKPTYFIFNEKEKVPRQQFYISLKYDTNNKSTFSNNQLVNLQHLKSNLISLIEEKQIHFQQKKWYLNFIKYITSPQRREQAIEIFDLLNIFEDLNTSQESKIQLLQIELDQLHRKGLVLYYKKEIPNFVWLNPLKIVTYIKEKVLIFDEIKKEKGILNIEYFKEKNIDHNILYLLQLQKVIFLHKYGINSNKEVIEEYIIPNYLPLVDKNNDIEYDLFTFGIHKHHIFTLKFTDFIPLGLINQLICFFGSLPDQKKFWRNQIIFTLESKCKILIYLDHENLKIKVFSHFLITDNDAKEKITRYIYSCILCFYWNFELITLKEYLKYEEEYILNDGDTLNNNLELNFYQSRRFYEIVDCDIPSDLYISMDTKTFIKADELSSIDQFTNTKINTYNLNLTNDQFEYSKEKAIYPFKIFTNKKLKKMKKVFVSYSHANIKEMEELTKYLIGFVRNKEIESWTDLKLQSGVKVKDEILQNLEDADIVILLISQDFIASDFIYDNELQMAMKKKITGKGEIIPVVLSNSSIFDLKLNVTGNEGSLSEVKMGEYYFIPQDENNNLKPIERWDHKSEAWMKVYNDLKKKISL